LAGRVSRGRNRVVGSEPAGERATPTPLRGQGPCPWDRTRAALEFEA